MSIYRVTDYIPQLEDMKKYPSNLYAIGNKSLLNRPIVSIVGTRRPSKYTQEMTLKLSSELAKRGVVVASGGAMGVDAIAHRGAGVSNTIAVVATGLNIRYPSINAPLIEAIEREGLVISMFKENFKATNWSFVVRNELVVALGKVLIITEADINSGSMRSAEYALKMGRDIFVLPHRLNESRGTNSLLARDKAKAIYSIEEFADSFGKSPSNSMPKDEFFYFCQNSPTIEEAVMNFGERVYEEELMGNIVIVNGRVRIN